MSRHLTMNTVIHAAVRRDIARLGHALDALPVGSRERAAELDVAWRHLDGQLYHHHHGEETIFWPALRELGADESLVGDLGGEHERMAEAMTRTRVAMAAMAADPSEERIAEAKAACAALSEVIETHFTHEERDLEPMMATSVGTPQWKKAQADIRKTQSLPEAGNYLTWLLDDADPDARAFVTHEIPKPVVFALTHLFGRSYNRTAAAWR